MDIKILNQIFNLFLTHLVIGVIIFNNRYSVFNSYKNKFINTVAVLQCSDGVMYNLIRSIFIIVSYLLPDTKEIHLTSLNNIIIMNYARCCKVENLIHCNTLNTYIASSRNITLSIPIRLNLILLLSVSLTCAELNGTFKIPFRLIMLTKGLTHICIYYRIWNYEQESAS